MTLDGKRQYGGFPPASGLYGPANEHDACGVGFVTNIAGTRSHGIIDKGIRVLENLLHRGAIGGDLTTGDGAGILFQVPDRFLRGECAGMDLPPEGEYGLGMVFMPSEKASRDECFGDR